MATYPALYVESNLDLFFRLVEEGRCPRRHTRPVAGRGRRHASCPAGPGSVNSTRDTGAMSVCTRAIRRDCVLLETDWGHCITTHQTRIIPSIIHWRTAYEQSIISTALQNVSYPTANDSIGRLLNSDHQLFTYTPTYNPITIRCIILKPES